MSHALRTRAPFTRRSAIEGNLSEIDSFTSGCFHSININIPAVCSHRGNGATFPIGFCAFAPVPLRASELLALLERGEGEGCVGAGRGKGCGAARASHQTDSEALAAFALPSCGGDLHSAFCFFCIGDSVSCRMTLPRAKNGANVQGAPAGKRGGRYRRMVRACSLMHCARACVTQAGPSERRVFEDKGRPRHCEGPSA